MDNSKKEPNKNDNDQVVDKPVAATPKDDLFNGGLRRQRGENILKSFYKN